MAANSSTSGVTSTLLLMCVYMNKKWGTNSKSAPEKEKERKKERKEKKKDNTIELNE